MADTRVLYTLLLALVVVLRLFELRIARRNTAAALAAGAVESGAGHFPWMVRLHSLFLLSCLGEVWLLGRPFVPLLAAVCLGALAAAMALRYWTIATLGERWTVRVITFPGRAAVTGGPFRFVRHPNYLGVVVEILVLPLIHTAWFTAIVFSLANAVLLRVRIGVEEAALAEHSDYRRLFAGRGAGAR